MDLHSLLSTQILTQHLFAALSPEQGMVVFAYFFIFIKFFLIFGIVFYAISALLLGMIFKKAGLPAWPAWVPVYNNWKVLEIGGQPGFWAVLAMVPLVNIVSMVFLVIAMHQIGLNLGKGGAFVLLAIFFPLIWLVILALDKSTWQGAPATDGQQPPITPQDPSTPPPYVPPANPTS